MQKSPILGCLFATTCILATTGCPNPNTYGTPRTVPAGSISHSIAPEAIGVHGNVQSNGELPNDLPTAPTYTMRIGVADSVDVGVRLANLSTLGADVKWNFVKGSRLDLAVQPGLQVFYYSAGSSSGSTSSSASISGTYLHLPLLLGLNLSRAVTLVPSAGIMYGAASASSSTSDSSGAKDSVKASANTGIIGRFGFGADFRLSPKFALHPEITFMRSFGRARTALSIWRASASTSVPCRATKT